MKPKKAVKSPRVVSRQRTALNRLVWSAGRLESKVSRVHVVSLAKACQAWLDVHPVHRKAK
jgi:hypothetical protein